MPSHDACFWRVAADPVGYHHGWRDAQATLGGNQRSAVNAALAAGLALGPPEHYHSLGPAGRRLIAGWAKVTAAAELLAIAKQPRAAQAHRDFLRAPVALQGFMQLGFQPYHPANVTPMGRAALRAWGGGYIMAGLSPVLPHWLAQRLAVQFDSIAVVPVVCPENFDHSCFWSALSHAQTANFTVGH
jgi:hypothetical protein